MEHPTSTVPELPTAMTIDDRVQVIHIALNPPRFIEVRGRTKDGTLRVWHLIITNKGKLSLL